VGEHESSVKESGLPTDTCTKYSVIITFEYQEAITTYKYGTMGCILAYQIIYLISCQHAFKYDLNLKLAPCIPSTAIISHYCRTACVTSLNTMELLRPGNSLFSSLLMISSATRSFFSSYSFPESP